MKFATGFAAIAGLIHVYIFYLESLSWGSTKTNRVFGVTADQAQTLSTFAYNQGFYNLFLAVAALGGALLVLMRGSIVGHTLMLYACASMLAAALVLWFSSPTLLRPVMIQGLPPLLALAAWFAARSFQG